MKSKDIKPCPFCGGKAIHDHFLEEYFKIYVIKCKSCDASTTACISRKQAIEAWNRRATDKTE